MNKNFLKTLLVIAIPISLQNLIASSINMADVFMIGRLGTEQIAGVGLGNQITFLCILFLFGVNNTGAIFVSQYYGNKDFGNIKKVLSLCILLSVAITLIFTVLALLIPEKLMRLYSSDPKVLKVATSYLVIIACSYIITGFSIAYSTCLRGMGKTQVSMYASIVALVVNVSLNYVLIFGKLGIPPLGVTGAAIATFIARFLELGFIFFFSKYNNYPLHLSLYDFKRNTPTFVKEFFVKGLPVIGSHIAWSLGTTITMAIYSRIGTVALSSMQIANAVSQIAFTGIIGIGSATGVIIGIELGRRKFYKAVQTAKKLTILNFIVGAIIAITLYFFINDIIKFYNISEEAKEQTRLALRYFCIIIPFSTVSFTNMTGTLRAGGDTGYIFAVDMFASWCMAVPLAFLGLHLSFPISLVYFMSVGGEVSTKFTLSLYRVIKLRWVRSLV